MDKTKLETRLQQIEAQISQTMANCNMLIGGKEEIKYWLNQLELSELTDTTVGGSE